MLGVRLPGARPQRGGSRMVPRPPQLECVPFTPLISRTLGPRGCWEEEKPVSWVVGAGNNLGSGGSVAPGLLARKELGAPASPQAAARGQGPDPASVPPGRQP